MKIRHISFLIGLCSLLFLISCKKDSKIGKDTFSSPKLLFVEYVSAYTSGYVSKKAEITIKLIKEVAEAEPGKEVIQNLFSFDPSVKGKAFWVDKKTIVFKPDTELASGQRYNTIFFLNKLIDVPKDKGEFKFTFECIKQNFDVKIEGISLYNAQDLNKVKLTGTIQTADQISKEEAEKILSANQNGNALQIIYEHGVGNNNHTFSIENIKRTDDQGEVEIEWDGEAIGVNRSDDEIYTIPSLKDFIVTSMQVMRSGDQYISVKFSDPIDDKQNLRGLVMLSQGTAPRVVVNLNELKIYATSNLEGDVDLTIDKSIKNAAGYSLKEDYTGNIQFSQQKPDVRIVANNGVIMPSSEGLIIPFEAISLNAVDLTILRIFENNVLQYLQVNELGGDYQLQRVGRPIAQQTIPLATMGVVNLNEWNRYSIDISKYISLEPGAFYQVKLGFRKSQSLFFCSEVNGEMDEDVFEEWEYNENTNWDGYEDEYYEYYDWDERENPCHKAYYEHNQGAQKIVFASDIGIIAKKADQGNLLVFTTNLITTDPILGAQIEVYDFQQQLITSGTSDNEGKVNLKVSGNPYALIVQKDKQFGYLKLDDGSALSLSNFNVTGNEIQKGIKGFIYGERGVWRPGDTLHISFILDDVQNRLPDGHPIILELYNPMGQLARQTALSKSAMGIYAFHPTTAKDAPTGNWLAKVKVGGAQFSKQIKVETVKPNRLKINLKFDGDKLYANQAAQYGDLNVRWLHGAVAKNLKASYEVLLVPAKTTFKNYEDVTFDDPSKEYITESEQIFDGRLDDQGNVRMAIKLQTGDEPPGMLKAIFKGKVFEEGGDFSIDNTTVQYVPYSSFAGIKVPDGDKRGMLVTDKDHNVRVVSVDSRGLPVDRKLEVSLYKLQWRWWWDNSWESKSNYSSTYYSALINSATVNTNDGEGIYKLRVDQPEWGRYMIIVKDPESGHSTGKIIFIDWPGWAGKQKRGELGGATMLDFSVEKESVQVGDFIRINIPSSEGGKALISLETGSEVLQTFWVPTKPENTVVEFVATSAMAPNIYANITMLQPHAQTSNDLPIRMYGVQAIEVIDPGTKLSPVITMPDELQSEQEFKVVVSEKDKKTMVYTIAIVEDGLLDLTKFKTPEPWNSFYAHEALGVKTWDVFDDVMGSYGGALEKLMAVGGDDEIKAPESDEANRFKPVVMFLGPFLAKAGAKNEHKFKLPQYIGSVRVMVVAGYDGAYGQSEKTIPVKQPLMILATLPRVVGPTEEIILPVNVFAMDKNIKDVELSVKTDGKLSLAESGTKSISFTEIGDRVVYFTLKAANSLGKGKVHVEAKSAGFSATYDVELQVRASNPSMSQAEEMLLEGGKSWDLNYNPLGLFSTNEAVIEISSLPPLNLEQRLKYLVDYPHGCIEQTTSSIFAQLYLDELIELDEKKLPKFRKISMLV